MGILVDVLLFKNNGVVTVIKVSNIDETLNDISIVEDTGSTQYPVKKFWIQKDGIERLYAYASLEDIDEGVLLQEINSVEIIPIITREL
ncbi:MAG: hypothetical protein WCB03_04300 [Rouxiella badensis]|uniref:hypothetical protein n=1 Tax=Rouxiella badensis TaxID=1646377 RepID=UPI003C5C89D5